MNQASTLLCITCGCACIGGINRATMAESDVKIRASVRRILSATAQYPLGPDSISSGEATSRITRIGKKAVPILIAEIDGSPSHFEWAIHLTQFRNDRIRKQIELQFQKWLKQRRIPPWESSTLSMEMRAQMSYLQWIRQSR